MNTKKEIKYLQAIEDANLYFDCSNDLGPWFKSINHALNQWKSNQDTKKRRKEDPEFRAKLCEYEKKTKLKRTAHGKRTAECAQRRAEQKQALPNWANKKKIHDIYAEAAKINKVFKPLGIQYHVDHIIPLVGKDKPNGEHIVCGLHVESNLRIIRDVENIRKGSTFVQ